MTWCDEVPGFCDAAGGTGSRATNDEEVAVQLKWAFSQRRP
jgi:hypothetical protein